MVNQRDTGSQGFEWLAVSHGKIEEAGFSIGSK